MSSLKDPMIRNLLTQLFGRRKIPWGMLQLRADRYAMSDVRWPDGLLPGTGDAISTNITTTWESVLAYTIYVGLLWQYTLLEDGLGCLKVCEEPLVGDPLPITCAGRLISQDLALSTLDLNFISRYIDMSKVVRIAEIGAGYGRLAYVITKLFPNIEYYIFDIPPALAIAQNYLTCVLGESKVAMFAESLQISSSHAIRAFLPHQMDLFPDGYFDLVINVSSFDEMTPAQVDNYFSKIDEKCSGWLYLQGHAQSRSPGLRWGVNEFPYRNGWTEICQRDHPFIGSFVERVYRL